MKLIDMTGWVMKEHGVPDSKWTVLKRDYSQAKTAWICKCECGAIKSVRSTHLRNGESKSCGCLVHEKRIDLTGKEYPHFKVLEFSPIPNGKNSSELYRWKCQCECSNIFYANTTNILRGRESCGCVQRKRLSEKFRKDLSSDTFGKLTPLYPLEKRAKNGGVIWHCLCECGNECDVVAYNLTAGMTTSCGCIKSKGEEQISRILRNLNVDFQREVKFNDFHYNDNPRSNPRFDFGIYLNNKLKLLIEYNGNIHYHTANDGWNTADELQKRQKRDDLKQQYCAEHNIPLEVICYLDYKNLETIIKQILIKYEIIPLTEQK